MSVTNRTEGVHRPKEMIAGHARRRRLAFTLIELLVVVAIISILTAIASVNYQNALVSSKVARFMGDCKAIERRGIHR